MRRIFLTTLLLSCVISAAAQALFSPDDTHIFYGGLNLGANFSQVDGDGFEGYHKVGVAGGGIVYVRFFHILGASLGLGYAQKGSHEASIRETTIGPAVFRYRLHLQYAELPLMLHLFTGGRLQYSAGISYNRLIDAREESEDINAIAISPELYPFRKQEWAGIAGIYFRISGPWMLSGQYQYTIGSIRSEPYIPPGYGFGRERNNLFSLRLLYIISSGEAR